MKALDDQMAAPDFWNDQESAQAKVAEKKTLMSVLAPLDEASAASEELDLTIEMAAEDEELASEVPGAVEKLEASIEELKLKALLNGAHDAAGAIITIRARDGGTDANDWAEMLLRMYLQLGQEARLFQVELTRPRRTTRKPASTTPAIAIRGPMAYGYLRGESGMHRLVRISPFNCRR